MKKRISILTFLFTFVFFSCYAESVTDSLPKEFFDNADLYSKLEMIENLSVLEKVSEHDLQLASQKTDSSVEEVNP